MVDAESVLVIMEKWTQMTHIVFIDCGSTLTKKGAGAIAGGLRTGLLPNLKYVFE